MYVSKSVSLFWNWRKVWLVVHECLSTSANNVARGQRVVFWDRTFQKWRGVYALDDDPAAAHLLNWDL